MKIKITRLLLLSLVVLLTVGLILTVTACGNNSEGGLNNPPEETPDEEIVTPDWEEDGVLKILMIGNSYTEDTMSYTYEIAEGLGIKDVYLAYLHWGGLTLANHAEYARNDSALYDYRVNTSGTWIKTLNYKMSDALKSQNWDYIGIQQVSMDSGDENSFGDLDYLTEYIMSNLKSGSKTRLVYNMTWAYAQNINTPLNKTAFDTKYGGSQKVMYNSIVNTVQKVILPHKCGFTVIPVGTAIQNARTSYLGDTMNRDGTHLSYDSGRYIAGLTLVGLLSGKDVRTISFMPKGMTTKMKSVAIESVSNALENPYEITQSLFTK